MKLGARQAIGVDIDPNALTAAQRNAQVNQVTTRFMHADQLAKDEIFDCVVANILTNTLCTMAPLLARRVVAGGHLLLSGILAGQVDQVSSAYHDFLTLEVSGQMEGWVCLSGQMPS